MSPGPIWLLPSTSLIYTSAWKVESNIEGRATFTITSFRNSLGSNTISGHVTTASATPCTALDFKTTVRCLSEARPMSFNFKGTEISVGAVNIESAKFTVARRPSFVP